MIPVNVFLSGSLCLSSSSHPGMECKLDKLFNSATYRIVFSVLNTVLQVALQALLIPVSQKAYEDLASRSCLGDILSSFDLLLENILLISLHLLALILHIIAVKNSSSSFAPFLLILFGLSFGSGIVQLVRIVKLQCKACDGICSTSSTVGMVIVITWRFCLSLIFLVIFVGWMTPWRSSFIKESSKRASIPTLLYLVCGTVVLANWKPKNDPLFYVWIATTALSLVTTIRISLLRHALRKNTQSSGPLAPVTRHADVNIHMRMSPQTLPSTTNASTGPSSSMSEPTTYSTGLTKSNKPSPETRSSVLTSATKSESRSSTEAGSGRSSIGAETFHTAVYSRSSMSSGSASVSTVGPLTPDPEQTSIRIRDSVRRTIMYTDSSSHASVAEEEPQPSRSSDSEQLPLPLNEPHRSLSLISNIPLPPSVPDELEFESPGLPEREAFPSSSSPISPSPAPSISPSTPTVPPYTEGPYSYRPRHDTLASNGTFETLPSYHSRRSTQTLTESIPPTPRRIRSLPPLPPLPPFISLSSVLLSFGGSSSTNPDTPTDDDHTINVDNT